MPLSAAGKTWQHVLTDSVCSHGLGLADPLHVLHVLSVLLCCCAAGPPPRLSLQPSWAYSTLSGPAGGVLLAKTATGELAWGDTWFDTITTRNPWNTDTGSCGSSAGSAAAVAAGMSGTACNGGSCRACCHGSMYTFSSTV
jgi:hypothetical protein